MVIPSFLWSHFLICKKEMAITDVVKTATVSINRGGHSLKIIKDQKNGSKRPRSSYVAQTQFTSILTQSLP